MSAVRAERAGGPLVTVYVVNRNYGRFLQQAIDSALSQDYPFLEVLVVDDASDDSSAEVLNRFAGDPRVQIIRNQVNRGLTVSSNTAIRASRGELVMRLDADDYLAPSAISKMVVEMVSEPSTVLVFPDYFEVDARGTTIRRVQRHDFNALEALSDLPAHGACTLVRREFIEALGGYDEEIPCQDGLDLWLSLNPQQRALRVGDPLFSYRQHGDNLTRDEGALLRARAKLIAKHVARRGLRRPRVLGIVPVRGQAVDPGSLPLRFLGDRPLIEWSVDEGLSCDRIDRLIVSSPDTDVLDHVRHRYGSRVGVHHRRVEAAGLNVDLARTQSDVLETEANEDRYYDFVMTLTIESPFRSAMYVQQAVDTMQLFDADGVVGVRRDDDAFYLHDGLGLRPTRSEGQLRRERDDLFRACGGMHLSRLTGCRSPARTGHVLLDQVAAFAVHTELDWGIAKHLAGLRR